MCVCGEMYCSDECKQAAARNFHEALCPGANADDRHPLRQLERLCKQTERTNPLVIARIYGSILQATKNGVPKDIAVEPFRKFISSPDPVPDEEAFVELLRRALAHNGNLEDCNRTACLLC
jgi:hypothetical protein